MKKATLLLTAVAAILFYSCNVSTNVSTANLSGVKMCDALTNDECKADNPVFSPATAKINVSVSLNNAPEDTKVTFSWHYMDSARTKIGEVVTDVSNVQTTGSSYVLHSTVEAPEGGWPTGDYEVEMKINTDNAKPLVKKFSVQ